MNQSTNWESPLNSRLAPGKSSNIINFQSKARALNWKQRILKELEELRQENQQIATQADEIFEELIHSLPLVIEQPSINIQEDDSILLEWYKKETEPNKPTIFSVIIEEHLIFSLLEQGNSSTCGSLNNDTRSYKIIGGLVEENFKVGQNANRNRA